MRGSQRGARRAGLKAEAPSASVYPAEIFRRARFEADERRKAAASAVEAFDACRRDVRERLQWDEGDQGEILMLMATFFILHEKGVEEATS